MSLNGFNIAEFKSVVLQNGLAKPNLYLVSFQQSSLPNKLMFYTHDVNLPPIDLDVQEIYRYGYGPREQVPFRPVFLPMTMTLMSEATTNNSIASIANFMNNIITFMNYSDMVSSVGGGGLSSTGSAYEIAYKSTYEFDIQVYVYNEAQNKILSYNFSQCYPKTMGDVQLGWNTIDALLTLNVTFNYTDFSITTIGSGQLTDDINSISSIQQQVGLSSSVLNNAAISYPQNVVDALNLNNAGTILSSVPNYAGGASSIDSAIAQSLFGV